MKLPIKSAPTRRAFILSAAAAAMVPHLYAKVGNVDIGVTGSIPEGQHIALTADNTLEDFNKAAAYGFDYFEPSGSLIASLSDSEFASFRDKVLASRIRCLAVNRLMAGPSLIVVGPTVNQDTITSYLESTLARAKQLGAVMVVWGSPGTRKVPVGFPMDKAWQQIQYFLQCAGEIAQSKNLLFAIEPCNFKETNTLNTATDTLRMLHDVNHPSVKLIIDTRHLRAEQEDPSVILRAGDQLVHFHWSSPDGGWPKTAEEDPNYGRMFKYIKEIYFHGSISIEARGSFEADAAPALAFFKKMLS